MNLAVKFSSFTKKHLQILKTHIFISLECGFVVQTRTFLGIPAGNKTGDGIHSGF